MKCRIHQRRLRRSLSAGQPLSPSLRGHLARCEPCRLLHRQWSAVQARLLAEAADPPALPEALAGRIVQAASAGQAAPAGEVGQTRAAPGGRLRPPARLIGLARRSPWAAALSAAASALLAAGVAYLLWPAGSPATTGGDRPGAGAAATAPHPAAPTPTDALIGPLWPDVRELAAAPLEAEMRYLADETRQLGTPCWPPCPAGCRPPALAKGPKPGPAPTPGAGAEPVGRPV